MPWWGWLLVDVVVVAVALGVVTTTTLSSYRTLRGFLARMSSVIADMPRIERPH